MFCRSVPGFNLQQNYAVKKKIIRINQKMPFKANLCAGRNNTIK